MPALASNLPLSPGTNWRHDATALDTALAAIAAFAPQALVISLGVDTFEGDPISRFTLRTDDFRKLGERLASLAIPTAIVQEGGYAVADIGHNVVGVLDAFA